MSRTFASLSFFNYRLWFAGALVSNVGTWMQRIAQDWVVLTDLTDDSGTAVGVVTALQFLPFLLLGPVAGLAADRFRPRRLLMVTQGASAVLGIALGALMLLGHIELWHMYGFAFALGIASAFDMPVRQTFVSSLVPQDSLTNAVSLNSASFNAARLVGPAIAGFAVAAIGSGWVFVINGFTFVATIVALWLMRADELQPVARARRGRGAIRAGLRHVRGRPEVVVIMICVSVVAMLGLNFQMTSAMMSRVEFGRGPADYGVVGSVLAIGSLTGALLAARRTRARLSVVLSSAAMFGVTSCAMALMPTFALYTAMGVFVGFSALTMLTSANAFIQTTTVPQMRGRVMALYSMVLMGSTPIGSPIIGVIGEHAGARWAIIVGGIASTLVAVAAALWSLRHWNVEVTYHRHRPRLEFTFPSNVNARDDAVLRLRAQHIEDASAQP
ncbi:MFS transporter [Demequina sp. NBRC 110056]|uniref:MFS transporter n=1 Tax=Demequina sp. NBRC 110056 TaxID=1570345 RepID=UPI0009FBF80E|nr:MFS transporter [Demequina sp. NBRC 110056]